MRCRWNVASRDALRTFALQKLQQRIGWPINFARVLWITKIDDSTAEIDEIVALESSLARFDLAFSAAPLQFKCLACPFIRRCLPLPLIRCLKRFHAAADVTGTD